MIKSHEQRPITKEYIASLILNKNYFNSMNQITKLVCLHVINKDYPLMLLHVIPPVDLVTIIAIQLYMATYLHKYHIIIQCQYTKLYCVCLFYYITNLITLSLIIILQWINQSVSLICI